MKTAVFGTGGVGGYFGGLLARAGHDVTFIARGAHLDAIKQNGLRVESQLDGRFTVPGNATSDTAEAGEQELVLFTVKMYHNSDAVSQIAPMVGENTLVLTLQNGIDNGEILAEAVGQDHVMIGSAYMEGRVSEPGVVTQGGPGTAAFGEMEVGIARRGEDLLQIFQDAGWRVNLHENMVGMLWKKFAYISGSAAVCAAANCVYEEMRTKPETRELIRAAISEALDVGRARGAPIMDDSLAWAMDSLDRFPGQGRASMAKDFTEQRPVELEGLTGTVVRMGREVGVPTPANDFLYAVLRPAAARIEALHS
ncbi:MAG: ketopantoate reductase family protein [SAR202 cluster bacterium]|nr:ketopantoate reductase family protein [SAR202 cluster bacterium]HCP23698.1 2-dehydropantoate 2-reductase [Dehalococcoidia bacterium]|tara:strand:+ start:1227 stop:2156 length:930 start_codon:yes stop_codon:yes gene_type:complete